MHFQKFKDLISIGEMSDTLPENNELINWNKLAVLAKVLRNVRKLQSAPFRYQSVPMIIDYLDSVIFLFNFFFFFFNICHMIYIAKSFE